MGRGRATLVGDVAPYEEMKLRLLNGSHSALAYLGALAGCEFIADAVASPDFAFFTRAFMDVDVTPTLTVPHGFDLVSYKEALMGRFADRALRHRTIQIAMDGSQKLPYRLLGTIASRLGAGHVPVTPAWPWPPGCGSSPSGEATMAPSSPGRPHGGTPPRRGGRAVDGRGHGGGVAEP